MSDEITDMFAIRPDRKGPKTIAILLMLGALFFGVLAYTDISNANSEELSPVSYTHLTLPTILLV